MNMGHLQLPYSSDKIRQVLVEHPLEVALHFLQRHLVRLVLT